MQQLFVTYPLLGIILLLILATLLVGYYVDNEVEIKTFISRFKRIKRKRC